ncbi:SDR family NAD(P)-dependent oxidoreductase [Streptomyces sp. NPDC002088]|uniref:SDR family NAD(P)-dependent oxidoreductase n=1 Tax=Streptomyces sp. NPDC002088 TaxID=3154665 RepID=UPI00332498E1
MDLTPNSGPEPPPHGHCRDPLRRSRRHVPPRPGVDRRVRHRTTPPNRTSTRKQQTIITGASAGIGSAAARTLAAKGEEVVLVSWSQAKRSPCGGRFRGASAERSSPRARVRPVQAARLPPWRWCSSWSSPPRNAGDHWGPPGRAGPLGREAGERRPGRTHGGSHRT